jgi:transposase-like protein
MFTNQHNRKNQKHLRNGSFTYVGKETSYITNIFRWTDLKIAFHSKNTIGNRLTHKNPTTNKYSLSGTYKLVCPDCNKAYVRQTGRRFSTRYIEHKAAFCNNCHTSSFAKHLNEEAHSFGPINKIMQILHSHKKGPHLNTIERFHIHAQSIANNHLHDNHTIFPNAVCDILLKTHHP